MICAMIPGSFDPITLGHLDVIERTCLFADRVVVAQGTNPRKSYRFAPDERLAMIREATAHLPGVEAMAMDGALVDAVREVGADLVVKGIRGGADIEWERAQAEANWEIGGVQTVWLPTRSALSHVSSSLVRELLALGKDASRYVPATIAGRMTDNGR
ncbi:pantetheine-phosphate adenylyltransferase [Actinomyces sp. B33]|uniref:pantetheine-phosphate adenylyltransferase n=1 Tax=Actinomyces sp. B33 TaxID=2942131 RepID=UPI0023404705|nr:pantetheine-phosphate adenylyltransferase [Actinomyces sp. B33]MDC4233112.1 pantetheine-phosphate adenylyltransferase [Actinomyces sp. B33]